MVICMFDFKFDWCPEMECGIKILDDQHRELFRIGRDMEQFIMNNCQNATWKQLLDIVCELREYTSYHFYTEESLMDKYNYPETIQHKAAHISFKVQILKIDMTALKENPSLVLPQIKENLQDFLFNHILVSDLALSKYLQACNME